MNLFRLKKKMFVFDSESLIHRPSCMASWVFVWWEDGYFHHRSSPRIINGKVDIARLWCGAEQGAQGLWNELLLNFISSTSHLTILWSNSWIEVDLFCYSLLKKKKADSVSRFLENSLRDQLHSNRRRNGLKWIEVPVSWAQTVPWRKCYRFRLPSPFRPLEMETGLVRVMTVIGRVCGLGNLGYRLGGLFEVGGVWRYRPNIRL